MTALMVAVALAMAAGMAIVAWAVLGDRPVRPWPQGYGR